MAVINDPDGYTNVRDDDGKVIAKVKKGERFIAAKPRNHPDDPKWPVCLRGGPGSVAVESRESPVSLIKRGFICSRTSH